MKPLYEKIHKNKIAGRIITDYHFRTVIFSLFSFAGNFAYAVFNIFIAAFSHSLWCGALACYHTVLVFLRGYILLNCYAAYTGRQKSSAEQTLLEVKRYRLCGVIFLVLTICLIALVLLIVREDKVFAYELYMIYMIAGYTLYQIVLAVLNYIKAQKDDSFTVRSLRSINLTAALVSLLSLQAIALDTFSRNVNIPLVNALTGFVVCGLIVAHGVSIIVKSTSKNWKISMRRIQSGKFCAIISQRNVRCFYESCNLLRKRTYRDQRSQLSHAG